MHAEIEIDAAPEKVFYWLEDSQRVMRWMPKVKVSEDLEVTPERVGSTFRQVYEENGRPMEFQGRVTAFEENRRIGVHLQGQFFDLDTVYTLEDLGGRTRLSQEADVTYKGLFKWMAPLLNLISKKSSQRELEEGFERLRGLSEGEAS